MQFLQADPEVESKIPLKFCLGIFRVSNVSDCPMGLKKPDLLWKSLKQPSKTVPWEFPWAAASGTPKGQFFQAAPLAFPQWTKTLDAHINKKSLL